MGGLVVEKRTCLFDGSLFYEDASGKRGNRPKILRSKLISVNKDKKESRISPTFLGWFFVDNLASQ